MSGDPDGLSAVGRHAIGGVLAHAPALSALLNPTVNSCKRMELRLGDALDALAADSELADVLGGYFVSSFLAYKRNEIERCVTGWEFREYAYHL